MIKTIIKWRIIFNENRIFDSLSYYNEILRSKKMLDECRRNTFFPTQKNKEDIQNCVNYKGMNFRVTLSKKAIDQ